MVVNFLFPFNDVLLQNYQKPEFTAEDKKRFYGIQIIMILVPFLIIFIGEAPPSQKAIYFVPAIFLNLCTLILSFFQSEKKIRLRLTINVLNISQMLMSACVMSVCFIDSQLGETLADSVRVMLVSELIFLILLVVWYRILLFYELKHGWPYKKNNWSKVPAATGAVVGCILAKLLSKELVTYLCCLLWIFFHLAASIAVLEYRKYTRFLSINENVIRGDDKEI